MQAGDAREGADGSSNGSSGSSGASSSSSAAALAACSYGAWYPAFAAVAHESEVLPLPAEFLAFLGEAGVVLHDNSAALPRRSRPTEVVVAGVDYDPDETYSSNESSSSDDGSGSGSGSDDGCPAAARLPWAQRFPELHAQIQATIARLGGTVAPRLNWSSPVDALWLTADNSLACRNADEVILLLKSSDRIMHDVEQLQALQAGGVHAQQQQPQQPQQPQQQQQQQPQQPQPPPPPPQQQQPQQPQQQQQQQPPLPQAQLVLRRWAALPPERQFRVFVAAHAPCGISQRDVSQHFPQLARDAAELAAIKARVLDFHARHVGSGFALGEYAMDVHVPHAGPVRLLDISAIEPTTSPLLFSWEELPLTAMRQQQQQQQQQQESQPSPAATAAAAAGGGSAEPEPAAAPAAAAVATAGSERAPGVELRVVSQPGLIQPGERVATGMPLDMLGLPDAFERALGAMQAQER